MKRPELHVWRNPEEAGQSMEAGDITCLYRDTYAGTSRGERLKWRRQVFQNARIVGIREDGLLALSADSKEERIRQVLKEMRKEEMVVTWNWMTVQANGLVTGRFEAAEEIGHGTEKGNIAAQFAQALQTGCTNPISRIPDIEMSRVHLVDADRFASIPRMPERAQGLRSLVVEANCSFTLTDGRGREYRGSFGAQQNDKRCLGWLDEGKPFNRALLESRISRNILG